MTVRPSCGLRSMLDLVVAAALLGVGILLIVKSRTLAKQWSNTEIPSSFRVMGGAKYGRITLISTGLAALVMAVVVVVRTIDT